MKKINLVRILTIFFLVAYIFVLLSIFQIGL